MNHYYSETQDSELKIVKKNVILRNKEIEVIFGSGTFSAKGLDFGSKTMANNMVINGDDDVLDLGCGNGVVGKVAAGLTVGRVVLTDINKRACKLAKMNTRDLKNVEIVQGNMFEPVSGKFDVILLNPPQTAGKKLCFEMIEKSKEYLKENGSLQLVARHRKGGKTLSERMEEVFGNMETVVKSGGYRVYLSRKSI